MYCGQSGYRLNKPPITVYGDNTQEYIRRTWRKNLDRVMVQAFSHGTL